MSLCHRFLVTSCFLGLFALAGCGGSSSNNTVVRGGTPTGNYSAASFKGQYAFAVSGQTSGGPFAIAGSLTADGNGNLTGIQDENSAGAVTSNVALTGTYAVTADGRGTATVSGSGSTFNYDFVLLSSSRALITRFDTFATASGSMDLQDTTAFTNAKISGQYAFLVTGVDSAAQPFSAAGNFTTDGAGTLASGTVDVNDGGSILNSTLTGNYSIAANGRGTLSVATNSGTLNYSVYVVNSTHFKMVETDSVPITSGDAYSQASPLSTASISGSYAYTAAGGLTAPLALGGLFATDGNGSITTAVTDVNNAGTQLSALASTGSYSLAANGRGSLTIASTSGSTQYVIYPTSGGVLMLSLDANVLAGTAYPQSVITAPVGNIGFNVTSANNNGESDVIGEAAVAPSGTFTGSMDANYPGSLTRSLALNGSFAAATGGRGILTYNTSLATTNAVYYPVSATRGLILETDVAQIGVGEYDVQQ